MSRSCHESLIFNLRAINTPAGTLIKISDNGFPTCCGCLQIYFIKFDEEHRNHSMEYMYVILRTLQSLQ